MLNDRSQSSANPIRSQRKWCRTNRNEALRNSCCIAFGTFALLIVGPAGSIAEEPDDQSPSTAGESTPDQPQPSKAIQNATEEIQRNPEDPRSYVLRADLYGDIRQYAKAIQDCDRAIQLSDQHAHAFYLRGCFRFANSDVRGALADFARYTDLRPESKMGLWQNGIVLYYAGQFREGAEQFASYQQVYPDDVENAVWRYLCMAQDEDVEKARAEILPIQKDRRVPMMEVYSLYRGKATPDEVLAAADAGSPSKEQLNRRRFYAHLYLGLFYEAQGEDKLAKRHLTIARDRYKIGHYMWDVANVHVGLFKKGRKLVPRKSPK